MEEYRGKYRKTSPRARYTYGKNKSNHAKGFLSGLFKQTIWAAIILAAVFMISSSSSPTAQSITKYIKSAISYQPDIEWALEDINTFFGRDTKKNTENNTNTENAEESVTASTEDNNEGTLE